MQRKLTLALIVGLSLGSNVGAFVGLDDTGDM